MSEKRVIFVDDEPSVIEGLQRMLRKSRGEWDMHFVSSGAEALEAMAKASFDVIVTDMKMAGMDGPELLEQVVERYPNTARIVLTGHASGEPTARALRVTHQFLAKPVEAEHLKVAIARACAVQQAVSNDRMRALVGGCDTLPSLPTLYREIVAAAESETANAGQIAEIISRDVALPAKLLQLVNSSFFGIGRRVSSIEQTVSLLGIVRIKALILSEGVFRQFVPSRPLPGFSIDVLWKHSLQVAEVARLITRAEEQGGDRPDQAFTAGLLHDIGILLLAHQQADELEAVLRTAHAERRPVCQVEMDLMSTTHAEIGAYLLGLWALPPRIVEAVALHHSPDQIPYDSLCALTAVHVADVLVSDLRRADSGDGHDLFAPQLDTAYLERIGLAHRLDRWRELAIDACQRSMEPQE